MFGGFARWEKHFSPVPTEGTYKNTWRASEESNEVLGDLCPLLALPQCHSWADLFLVHVNTVNQAEHQ